MLGTGCDKPGLFHGTIGDRASGESEAPESAAMKVTENAEDFEEKMYSAGYSFAAGFFEAIADFIGEALSGDDDDEDDGEDDYA